ncbi:TauD/TfdA family dioxygenase [Pseudonocardia sp. TRM90224]|uniref:TauD/TfdA family dioxygenase n=1 Tax=Pseudonocardia sp. TRM90224 TaxID=2812678 RepID=UPI001E330870|nr:TauD/TfdA family dioxygenase [Pseudonocardia sp. TRM90224]
MSTNNPGFPPAPSRPAPPFAVQTAPGRPPLVLAPNGPDPEGWVGYNRGALRGALAQYGALLVRGLGLHDPAQVGSVFRLLGGELMAEREAFAQRESFPGGVYSSTKWPSNQPMCMHHELSYTAEAPGLMMFACLTAPTSGGATCVADSAAVLNALPRGLVERFEHEGWVLARNYNDEIGASVVETFGTDDPATVEAYCRANAIEFQWQPDGGLRTWQRRSAVRRHPATGQLCWFNQIAFLNEWTMDQDVRAFLVEMYGPQGLPFTTLFGNGEPVGPQVVELINQAYDAHTMREAWRPGDLLLVDNLRSAHSREAFEGERQILVGMAEPMRLTPHGGAA